MSYASGQHGKAECDRCGFWYLYKEMRTEPGTSWRVCRTCDDKDFSLTKHPQNFPAPPRADQRPLEHPRPDRANYVNDTEWDLRDSIYYVSTST